MVELQEFPGCVRVGECGVEKVDLHSRVVVAGGGVGVEVDGCVLVGG